MDPDRISVFLCGDVMTGRGVDQILPHPSEPRLHEPHLRDAREYVWLAEQASGPIPRPAPFSYPFGEALAILDERAPDVRVANLETSITRSASPWRGKDVCYRMHPANEACLREAGLDVCVLANNHAVDYGRAGLLETLDVLHHAGLHTAGAGRTLDEAQAPAVVPLPTGGRLLVFAIAAPTCGAPPAWEATAARPGIALLPELTDEAARALLDRVQGTRRPGDRVIVSIHWGPNWGWEVEAEQVRFAHLLVDGGVDLVHGHSSHHPKPIELYRGRLILYGCGDFIDDYEGIAGHAGFRDELRPMYFATLSASTGALEALELVPLRARHLTLERASAEERAWLAATLERISRPFGAKLEQADGSLRLRVPERHEGSIANPRRASMSERVWGHCRNCKNFASPARIPLDDEEAACKHPELSRYRLLVFGAGGCDGFELRAGLAESEERPSLVT